MLSSFLIQLFIIDGPCLDTVSAFEQLAQTTCSLSLTLLCLEHARAGTTYVFLIGGRGWLTHLWLKASSETNTIYTMHL